HSLPMMIGISLILFPKLALGMSGFETGVAVMPLVRGDKSDDPENPTGRIRNTRKLLLTAAIIMAVFLMASSLLTTLLIPAAAFQVGGAANGRALAYLAHKYMGEGFGTVYDISTILILWFAGASAMAGLLNLVPRYLPRYGMAPNWSRAQRPLVLVFTIITFAVTWIFNADVDAQAGAYATGVLVLFTSAAFATTLATWREGLNKRFLFGSILLVFIYTTIANMIERPEGIHIASFFIGAILITSLVSRTMRSLELRIHSVSFDETARAFVRHSLNHGVICLFAHRPGSTDYEAKESETRKVHKLTEDEATFIFLEIELGDPSDFGDECLNVAGVEIDGKRILRCKSAAIPNAIAAVLLHLRDSTETIPHAYFGWTEGHPLSYIVKYIFLGEGETAPVTREILREV
ncbi:MAG: amino acid transporter, partial [Anaerolineae bacterium]|nr:amino acid transporter [Anaerolineae bacterium]